LPDLLWRYVETTTTSLPCLWRSEWHCFHDLLRHFITSLLGLGICADYFSEKKENFKGVLFLRIQVVCGDCSNRKLALSYCGMREKRVCDNCNVIITSWRLKSPKACIYRQNRPLTKQVKQAVPLLHYITISLLFFDLTFGQCSANSTDQQQTHFRRLLLCGSVRSCNPLFTVASNRHWPNLALWTSVFMHTVFQRSRECCC
jgi:hypothetical protein